MGPRTRIGKHAWLPLFLLTLTINIVYAQAGGASASCAVSAVPRQVLSEGVTEPVGNIVLQCSSANPGTMFTGNYTVLFPVDVTNRIDADSLTTDALFSVDYGLGYTPVPGVSGQISGHTISFNGVAITVPPSGRFAIQISNLRVNVSEFGGSTGQPLLASLSLSAAVNLDQAQVVVANAATGLYATLQSGGITCSISPQPATIDLTGFFAAGTAFFTTRVTEGFGTAFSPRATGADSGTRFLITYTGFPANAQLYVPNLVAGYDARTPTAAGDLGLTQSGGQYLPGSGALLLALVAGADATGAGGTPFPAPTGSGPVALNSASQVSMAGGTGYAVYEVVDANPSVIQSAQIPTFVVLTQATAPTVAQESLSLAPVSQTPTASVTAPVPRFVAVTPPPDCGIVGDCQAAYFPKLSVAPIPIQFTLIAGAVSGSPGYIYVQNTGGGIMNWSASVNYLNGAGWLVVDQTSHQNNATLRVDAQPQGLALGVYHANVVVDAGPLAGSATIPVTLTIETAAVLPPSPPVTVTKVLNAASLAATPMVAGSLAVVMGTSLAGKTVAVTWNGIAASLIYDSASQIYLQIPASLSTQNTATLVATVDGVSSAPQTVQLAPAWPSIFAHAVRNQDFSENTASDPAAAGSMLQIFLTGIPAGATVSAQIQNRSGLTPAYAGPAPGVTGVQQVSLAVPDLPPQTTQLVICASTNAQQFCTAEYPLSIE
jgi:uncharacterized protein (TIGR03437 family)